jgi:hypothetical protein
MMMKTSASKLTLAQPVVYQIRVPGHLDESWLDWFDDISVEIVCDETGLPITNLVGTFDQAALIGLLRRLYSLGLPLISVAYLEEMKIKI